MSLFSSVSYLPLLVGAAVFTVTILYYVHFWIEQIRDSKKHISEYGYASYKIFKKFFNNISWKPYLIDCLIDDTEESKIVADRYVFEGKGMIMRDPISFYLSQRLIISKTKELKKEKHGRNTVKWQ